MAYSDRCAGNQRMERQAHFAHSINKRIFVALETMSASGHSGDAQPNETLAKAGEKALLACVDETDIADGAVFHYYKNNWGSGKPGWPSHA